MMGHIMDEIRVLLQGHNDPSNMIDLRGIGESLMLACTMDGKMASWPITLVAGRLAGITKDEMAD